MRRLTRDGTVEPVSRDKFSGANRDKYLLFSLFVDTYIILVHIYAWLRAKQASNLAASASQHRPRRSGVGVAYNFFCRALARTVHGAGGSKKPTASSGE